MNQFLQEFISLIYNGYVKNPMSQSQGPVIPPKGLKILPLVHVWMLIVCTETIHCSFLLTDICTKRFIPYVYCSSDQLTYLLVQLYAITSLFCSTVYSKYTEFPNDREFLDSPPESQVHPIPAFLYGCVSVLFSLPCQP